MEKMLETLSELIKIDSVAMVDVSEQYPFGKKGAEVLDKMLAICREMGFRTKNCDNRVGWAEVGEGDEMIGILAHLDVVPAGDGWDYPPFELTDAGDRIYGRGTGDDKGPAVVNLYAIKELMDEGVKFNRRVRLIFGISEETGGFNDIAYYNAHEEAPSFGYTPDGWFPVVVCEKVIGRYRISMPLEKSGIVYADAGTVVNVVPEKCRIIYRQKDGNTVELFTTGKASHGSAPEDGVNAITKAMEAAAADEKADFPFASIYMKHIGYEVNGKNAGIGFEDDKSGLLTMNAGVLAVENDSLALYIDCRIPVDYDEKIVLERLKETFGPYGMTVNITDSLPSVYVDKDSALVRTLIDTYVEETGDTVSQPIITGGGTYAKSMKNVVAFGAGLAGREHTEHMPNEYVLKEDLLIQKEIYKKTIRRLLELDSLNTNN